MVQGELTIPIINELGTAEHKEVFMQPAIAGEWIGALGISEPGGGSDVAALRTTARADGDELVISGQKLWITNGSRADFIVLAVRTGDRPPRHFAGPVSHQHARLLGRQETQESRQSLFRYRGAYSSTIAAFRRAIS